MGYKHPSGNGFTSVAAIENATKYAIDMGADIIVTATDFSDKANGIEGDTAIEDCALLARDAGLLWFNGSGPYGPFEDHAPMALADVENAVLVTGLDREDNIVQARRNTENDLAACARMIWATDPRMAAPADSQHTYSRVYGTSLCGPQAAAVAALVLSRYPHYTAPEIKDKLLSYTDDIYSYWDNDQYVGLLGRGRINAYRALTFYGPVATTADDTTWSHDIWLSGDIVVPSGKTLTIDPGVSVYVAADDITSMGGLTDSVEIVVDGALACHGTAENPIVFTVIGGDPAAKWGPIFLRGADGQSSIWLEHCIFRNIGSFLKVEDQSGEAEVYISDCTIDTSEDGILFQPSHNGSSMALLSTSLTSSNYHATTGVNIMTGGVTNPSIILDGLVIDNYEIGLSVNAGDQTSINEVDILSAASFGVKLASSQTTQPSLTGPITVHFNTGWPFRI